MIKRLLVANRGEIAVRVIKTCRKLGISCAAVYSDADRDALHVAQADAAFYIGSSEAKASYLNADAIIEAAKRFKADAIHPGYGFLSESEALIERCEAEGILFVGPHREAIRKMGSKSAAKALAEDVGAPTVPGYHGANQDPDFLREKASEIGYPVLIKASAGGGGKGMRIVNSDEEFAGALSQVCTEAGSAFGSSQVLLEKYLRVSRHIEVQVVGDKLGSVIHLLERECSIQRNYQKVIEEAPAAFLSDDIKATLFSSALSIAKGIQYDSVGTVEFILDQQTGTPYFLEMNTRLQVEHPTTELVTGLDLVELQIKAAAGLPLEIEQSEVVAKGWAIEARVNAENPAKGYIPELGRVSSFVPAQMTGVRYDTGVVDGYEVSPYYDSMIAKVIAHGDDRSVARERLIRALGETVLAGVGSNISFLADLLQAPAFLVQPLTTGYISECFPDGWSAHQGSRDVAVTVAAVSLAMKAEYPVDNTPWQTLGGLRVIENSGHPGATALYFDHQDDDRIEVKISGHAGRYRVAVDDGAAFSLLATERDNRLYIETDGVKKPCFCAQNGSDVVVSVDGETYQFTIIEREQQFGGQSDGALGDENQILSPLPGLITEILVAVGDDVEAGQIVLTMEAMKMVHSLKAPRAGTVEAIRCEQGATVQGSESLIRLQE